MAERPTPVPDLDWDPARSRLFADRATDLWQELIDSGVRLDPVLIEGCWREIDTGQDLDRARALVESSWKEWS